MLRDTIVCKMRNEGLQKRLLSDKKLTLGKVIVDTLAAEMAEQNARVEEYCRNELFENGYGYEKKKLINPQRHREKERKCTSHVAGVKETMYH